MLFYLASDYFNAHVQSKNPSRDATKIYNNFTNYLKMHAKVNFYVKHLCKGFNTSSYVQKILIF